MPLPDLLLSLRVLAMGNQPARAGWDWPDGTRVEIAWEVIELDDPGFVVESLAVYGGQRRVSKEEMRLIADALPHGLKVGEGSGRAPWDEHDCVLVAVPKPGFQRWCTGGCGRPGPLAKGSFIGFCATCSAERRERMISDPYGRGG